MVVFGASRWFIVRVDYALRFLHLTDVPILVDVSELHALPPFPGSV
jgi:hypothetical protein